MTITKMQPGYRVRMTVFMPYDPTDTKSIRDALDYADKLKALGDGAPPDSTVEHFSFQSGRQDVQESAGAAKPKAPGK